jgi:hypothetical protein
VKFVEKPYIAGMKLKCGKLNLSQSQQKEKTMNKQATLIIAASTLLLAACSSSPQVKQSYGPNGNPSYQITCNNMGASLSSCYQKAGEICKEKGYVVVSQFSDAPLANIVAECKP